MDHGGKRHSAGRKSKAEEQKLIEKLSPLNTIALKALKTALKNEDSWAVKLYFEYFYGKPKQTIDQNITVDNFDIKEALKFDNPE